MHIPVANQAQVTECTDLNITYDFTIAPPDHVFGGTPNARLTDRGGLVNVPESYPFLDLNDTQSDPKLLQRSWKAAVLTNMSIMRTWNETRNYTYMGKEYWLEDLVDTLWLLDITASNPRQVAFSGFGSSAIGYFDPHLPGPLSSVRSSDRYYGNGTKAYIGECHG